MEIYSEQIKYLPIGWKETVLGAILFLKNGFAFKSSAYQENGTSVIRISDIQDGVVTTKSSMRIKTSEEFNNYLVHKGDILIAMSGATTGKYGIYKQTELAYQNQRVGNFRLYSDDLINKKFIFFLLGSLKREIERKAYGGAQPNISGKNIERLKFNLPPLLEQHQIVAKIEELFSGLDNAIESLKKAREQMKTYRQAVLKYAFEGKLTKEWRTQQIQVGNPPEPAEKLLERIKAEREEHHQRQLEGWKKACEQARTAGKKSPPKPKKQKELPPLLEKELAELPKLPERWGWLQLKEITTVLGDGLHGTPIYSDEGDYYFINGNNLADGKIEIKENTKRVAIEEYKKYKKPLNENTVLVSINGTLGNTAFYNREKVVLGKSACYFNILNIIDKYYVRYCITSQRFKNYAYRNATGSTIKNVSLKAMRKFEIPIPPTPEEQQAIVAEIEFRLSVCDQLEKTIKDSLRKAEALRQSILKKAFNGELTQEWREKHPELISGENSAESVLARIRAEKDKTHRRGAKSAEGK